MVNSWHLDGSHGWLQLVENEVPEGLKGIANRRVYAHHTAVLLDDPRRSVLAAGQIVECSMGPNPAAEYSD